MTTAISPTLGDSAAAFRERLRRDGADPGDLSRIGIILIIIGAVTLLLPGLVTVTVEVLVGFALLIAGGFEAVHAIPFRSERGSGWHLARGVIGLLAGTMFLLSPVSGAWTLTVVIGGMLAASGVLQTAYAIRLRHLRGWFWALINGLIALAAGLAILLLSPVVAPWLLGVLVGAEFLLTGAWMLALGRAASDKNTSGR